MNLLFVSASFPTDFQQSVHGTYKRMGVLIEALRGIGRLDMLFYVPPRMEISPATEEETKQGFARLWGCEDFGLTLCHKPEHGAQDDWWQRYVAPATSIFRQGVCDDTSGGEQVRALQACLSRKPDAVFAHRLSAMCPLLRIGDVPPVFFDLDDIEHVALARAISQPPHWRSKRLQYLQLPALLAGERRAIRLSHTTFVCSENDRAHLAKKFGLDNLAVLPNAVDIPPARPYQVAPHLLFVGSFSYTPNVNAAEFLVTRIWPLIKNQVPDARLTIVGAKPEQIPSFRAKPDGVTFAGFVENLEAVYQDSRVVCCPILSGGGTRVKILEAAAHGKPIVATTLGAEGIEFRDGTEILLRDDAQSFADACVALLRDELQCHRLGNAARAAVTERYQRARIVESLRAHIQSSLA